MLRKLAKREVLDQLAGVRRMADEAGMDAGKWKLRVPRNYETPTMDSVVDVKTVGGTAYLCPMPYMDGALPKILALMADGEPVEITAGDAERLLSRSPADEVAIGWPGGRLKSCVCRVVAVSQGGDGTVFAFPGPMDLDKVNEEVQEYREAHGCPTPGIDCEQCGGIVGCEILRAAGELAKSRRERPLDTAGGDMVK